MHMMNVIHYGKGMLKRCGECFFQSSPSFNGDRTEKPGGNRNNEQIKKNLETCSTRGMDCLHPTDTDGWSCSAAAVGRVVRHGCTRPQARFYRAPPVCEICGGRRGLPPGVGGRGRRKRAALELTGA